MDTRFLESLVIIAKCGSIAEAARRQNLTPAALVQRIRALESELNCKLLTRVGRTSQLTEAGIAVLPHARALIRSTRDLRAIAASDLPAGQLRIGATTTAMTGQIPLIIKELRAHCPSIDYFLQPGSSIDLYQSVLAGDLDAAIVMQPPFSLPKSLQWYTLRKDSFVLLMPENIDETDWIKAVMAMPFIRYDRNSWGGQIIQRFLQEQGVVVSELLELDAPEAIAALVSCGLGIAIVPDWAPPWPEGLRLRKLLIPDIEPRVVGIVWGNSGAHLAALRAFVEACHKLFQT